MSFGVGPLVGSLTGQGGAGLPGFDNSSSAESRAGPITVGGLTFAPKRNDTLVIGLTIVVAAAIFFTRKR